MGQVEGEAVCAATGVQPLSSSPPQSPTECVESTCQDSQNDEEQEHQDQDLSQVSLGHHLLHGRGKEVIAELSIAKTNGTL